LISQPGNTTGLWADPLVQGLYPTGTNVVTAQAGGLNPVLVGAQDPSNLLQNLRVDASGNLRVAEGFSFTNYGSPAAEAANVYVVNPITATFTETSIGVTQVTSPWVVSGTVAVTQSTNPWLVQTESNGVTNEIVPAETNLVGGSDGQYLRSLYVDPYGKLILPSQNPIGDQLVSIRLNQVAVNFSHGFNPLLVTNTVNTTGTATTSLGAAIYSTGTDPAGSATGTSVGTLDYHAGHVWYTEHSTAFTPGTTNSYQRIGAYNATDGFWVGWEVIAAVPTFCFTHLSNSVPTFVPQSAWNGDPFDGSADSKFRSNGVPVAANWSKINIFRFRGSWFGAAPVFFEVFSPDNVWVTAHTLRFPNTLTSPYTTTTNWNVQVAVANTGNASNLAITTPCWAMGVDDITDRIEDALTTESYALTTRAVLTGEIADTGTFSNVSLTPESALSVGPSGAVFVNAATWDDTTPGGATLPMIVNSFSYNSLSVVLVGSGGGFASGAITFEASLDNSNWIGLSGLNINTATAMPNAIFTLADNGATALLFNITGFNYFRARLSTAITNSGSPPGNATVSISYNREGLATPNISTTINTGTISVASNQGAPNTDANAWPVKITDGANGDVVVKPASTAALATDKALVVAVSPNNSIGVTQVTSPWVVDGTVTADQGGVWTVGIAASQTVAVTNTGTFAVQAAQSGTWNIGTVTSVGSITSALPAGGNTIGAVNVSSSGTPISATGSSLNVDVTGGTLVATQGGTWTVDIAAAQTIAVTNTGTFAVQEATLDGCISAGKVAVSVPGTVAVTQSTSPWVVTGATADGTTTETPILVVGGETNDATPQYQPIPLSAGGAAVIISGTVAVTQSTSPWVVSQAAGPWSVNLTQLNSVALASPTAYGSAPTGNVIGVNAYVTNTPTVNQGTSPWVTSLASTTITGTVAVTESGTWSVRAQDGAGNALTSNSTVPAGHFALDQNITSILGTAPTTAGFIDVKGADGNVFVRQGTAANLNATVVGTGTFAVQATVENTLTINYANTSPATQNITAQDVGSTSTTVSNNQVFVTGVPTPGSVASFALAAGYTTVQMLVTGAWTGTLVTEISVDGGTTWARQNIHQTGTNYLATTFTDNFEGGGGVSGATNFRVRATAAWTGTATVLIALSPSTHVVDVNNPIRICDSSFNTINSTSEGSPATTGLNVHVQNASPISVSNTGTFAVQPSGTVDTAPATQNITARDTNSTSTVGANSQTLITGSPTAGSAANFALASGYDTFQVLTTGAWTGTLAVEVSMDGGTTWVSRNVHLPGTSYVTGTFTANFLGSGNCAGYTNVRVRSTAAWTGTATVRILETPNVHILDVSNPLRLCDSTTPSIGLTIKSIVEGSPATSVTAACVDIASIGGTGVGEDGILPTMPGSPNPNTGANWLHNVINISAASGTQSLLGGIVGTTIRVMKVQFTTNAAANFYFVDSGSSVLSGTYILTGNGSSFSDFGNGQILWTTGVGKGFQINLSATATLGGDIWYTQS